MRRRVIVVLLVLIGITILAYVAPSLRAAPEQPIAFSHRAHAGTRQIPCLYCHHYAAESNVASVPAVEVCAGCHRVVMTNDPQVQKVMSYFSNQQSIPWVRVYRVPEFVYFTHQMHVTNGVGCENCHGNVPAMERIGQAQPITMGWCLNCHRSRGAPTDCWTCHK